MILDYLCFNGASFHEMLRNVVFVCLINCLISHWTAPNTQRSEQKKKKRIKEVNEKMWSLFVPFSTFFSLCRFRFVHHRLLHPTNVCTYLIISTSMRVNCIECVEKFFGSRFACFFFGIFMFFVRAVFAFSFFHENFATTTGSEHMH